MKKSNCQSNAVKGNVHPKPQAFVLPSGWISVEPQTCVSFRTPAETFIAPVVDLS